jgi:hypothetical protein
MVRVAGYETATDWFTLFKPFLNCSQILTRLFI